MYLFSGASTTYILPTTVASAARVDLYSGCQSMNAGVYKPCTPAVYTPAPYSYRYRVLEYKRINTIIPHFFHTSNSTSEQWSTAFVELCGRIQSYIKAETPLPSPSPTHTHEIEFLVVTLTKGSETF